MGLELCHLQWYWKKDLIIDKAVMKGKKVELSRHNIEEMRWNCKMARLCLQDHWNDKSEYEKRCKEAKWYIDFAILVFDEAAKKINMKRLQYVLPDIELTKTIMRDNKQ